MTPSNLILASRSPRRVELLKLIASQFETIPSQFDESTITITNPNELVKALGYYKAKTVFDEHPQATVIGCDTIVSLDGEVFGIPKDKQHAVDMLRKLSGKTHLVSTGVCILSKNQVDQFVVETKVTFYKLSEEEIEVYCNTKEPFDKAGAYGIQEKGSLFVESIEGDYFSVMGFPVAKVNQVLKQYKW
ncbi:Maf family protein [Paludicola sp. MB14-C6]|uniref:Maf family protein n=1 Tax=Paludihabitans sp. MB14-C6 TaxID=3070656 RepID=UPI0027DC5C8F|nr:Maf family protein [Paludicola sp. MB14-C6]WMJ21866.1 Maf family protein [Paludicola sp. MB14-C6]